MDGPLFSIIVPIYNAKEYIRECIESLLDQTYRNLEIILVDDGSTDGSSGICDFYAEQDSRVTVIHQTNGGQTSARIAGAKRASGDYVACVDGDDWVDKKYFERFAQIVKSYNPDIISCLFMIAEPFRTYPQKCNVRLGFYGKAQIRDELFPLLVEDEDGTFLGYNLFAKVIKRELYVSCQESVDTRLKFGEDCVCLKPCILHADSFFQSDEPLYYYRQNSGSATHVRRAYDWSQPELMGRHLDRYLITPDYDFREQIDRMVARQVFEVAASQFYENKPYWKTAAEIRKHLGENYYDAMVKRCRYKSLKGRIKLFALKHRFCFVLMLYNRLCMARRK